MLCILALLMLTCGCGKKAGTEKQGEGGAASENVPVVRMDPIEEGKKAVTPEAPKEKEAKYLVAIDPGHQAWDVDMSDTEPNAPGSDVMKQKATSGTEGSYSGIPEYELNMDISLLLRDELQDRGYEVLLTREDNQTAISNAERARMANGAGADIYIRIHANGSESASSQGALALIPSAENPYTAGLYEKSRKLAEDVLEEYCVSTGFSSQGIQENDTMTGINWSKVPVMILEMGFMTNEHDDLAMADDSFRLKMIDGIANGVDEYFGQASSEQAEESGNPEGTEPSADASGEDLETALKGMVVDQNGERWSACVRKAGESVPAATVNERAQQSASLIKLFIAAAAELERGELEALEQYPGETGELISRMLSASDNEAANALTRRLGDGDAAAGMEKVNLFCSLNGYSSTSMGRLMLDFDAQSDNYTSAADCCKFLNSVLQGGVTGSDEILSALKKQERTGKLPAGVPGGIKTANKTGELDDVENDAAIVWAEGNTYIICVMSEGLNDASEARGKITEISGMVYDSMEN